MLARALSWARGGADVPLSAAPPKAEAEADADTAALDRTSSTAGPSCLICLEALSPADFESGAAISLACACRGDLALRHRACAERWAAAKGDATCEMCRSLITNITPPPPRPAADAREAEARLAPGMGVLPGGPGFGLWSGGAGGPGLMVWPPGAAALAARLPPGHPLLAALADGTLPPLPHPADHSPFAPPPLPSGAETALELVRVAWLVAVIAVLFLDASLAGGLSLGLVVACLVVGAGRAAGAAREAALSAALAGWGGGALVAGMGQQRGGRREGQQAAAGVADAV